MAALLNDIIAAGGTTAFTDPVTGAILRDWMAAGDAWHVAEIDGDLCGFQWIGPHADLPEDTCDIATFVAREQHGVGIGSALFEATRKAAKTLGYSRIVAVIRSDNAGGRSYYGSRGFETQKTLKNIALADGTIVDKVVASYRL